jgi:hypothetical protein
VDVAGAVAVPHVFGGLSLQLVWQLDVIASIVQ